jgi:hypothetical protein
VQLKFSLSFTSLTLLQYLRTRLGQLQSPDALHLLALFKVAGKREYVHRQRVPRELGFDSELELPLFSIPRQPLNSEYLLQGYFVLECH